MSHRFLEIHPAHPRFVGTTADSDDAAPVGTPADLAIGRPLAVFRPEGYEPNYAYPLLVWFHDAGEDERTLHRIMPQVSDRNVVGAAIRGDRLRTEGGFDWSTTAGDRREQALLTAVRSLRRSYHVHSERIVLAGRGTGAAAAAELFFARPEWFGGLALFDPPADALPVDLMPRDDLAGKPVLLDLPIVRLGCGREGAGRLAATGLDVTLRHGRPGDRHRDGLRHLDRWLISAVCAVKV